MNAFGVKFSDNEPVFIKEYREVSELAQFVDGSNVSDWAKASVAVVVKKEMVEGSDGKIVAPNADITRAETAAIVRRLLEKSGLI